MANANFSPFFASFTETLTKDGTVLPVNAAGNYIFVKEANHRFQMRLDNGRWFEFDQSFYIRVEDGFNKVEFKAIDTTEDTQVEFYVCSREIGAHLNIIRQPTNFQSFQYFQAKTICKGYDSDTLAAGGSTTFWGTGGSDAGYAGPEYAYRKAIIVTNNDPSSVLELILGDGSGTRLGTVQPLKAWMMETSENIIVKNETAAPINLRVCEIFYPAA